MTTIMPRAPVVIPDRKPISFERQAQEVLGQLRMAMAALIQAIPAPGKLRRATDLQNVLGIHSKLAWQVFRVATASNVLEEGRAVPGATAMARFLEAAARRGVPESNIEDVQRAFERFEETVTLTAGNRSAFDSMLTGLTEDGSDPLDLTHKRAAFKAFSHFLGAQAKATMACTVFHPSQHDPESLDMILLKGLIGLSKQRRDSSILLSNIWTAHDDGSPTKYRGLEPLDPVGVHQGVSLFREFCTEPLPPIRTVKQPDGSIKVLLDGDLIDSQSAVTIILGFVMRGAIPRYKGAISKTSGAACAIRTPSEALIEHVLVHEDLFERTTPRVDVYYDLGDGMVAKELRPHDRSSLRESVVYLGRGPSVLDTPEMPRHKEMVMAALGKVGWDAEKFDVYRCRVEFPVVPSTVGIEFDLPEKEG
jgi:hypothetical protein